jgi:hypothetical protein
MQVDAEGIYDEAEEEWDMEAAVLRTMPQKQGSLDGSDEDGLIDL